MGRTVKDALLSLAVLRTQVVPLDDGVSVTVQEPPADALASYGQLWRNDRQKATAVLLRACVIDENGQPMLDDEESLKLARSARIARPLVEAIMAGSVKIE